MVGFIDKRPKGKPELYAVAISYAHEGAAPRVRWGWYCGLSAMSNPPRHVVFTDDVSSPRIRRYYNAQIAETKIVRDIFTDSRVRSAVIVPLDPARRPALTVFNVNALRRRNPR